MDWFVSESTKIYQDYDVVEVEVFGRRCRKEPVNLVILKDKQIYCLDLATFEKHVISDIESSGASVFTGMCGYINENKQIQISAIMDNTQIC